MLIIIVLFVIAVWYLAGAAWTLMAIAPIVAVIPIAIAIDVVRCVANAPKRRAAEGRRREFEARIQRSLRRHEEMFPDAHDYDEDGIPYL